jgi:fatty acid desaturase
LRAADRAATDERRQGVVAVLPASPSGRHADQSPTVVQRRSARPVDVISRKRVRQRHESEVRPLPAVTQFSPEEFQSLRNKRTLPRLASLPLAGLGMLAVGWGAGDDSGAIAACLAAFTASMMFCWTSALHEAAHQTLWHSPTLSVWSGRLLGTFMFTPYSVYREVHIRHHAYLNRPEDWELWPYADPRASLGFRRLFAWFDLFGGVAAGPLIYGRMFFHPRSPLKSPALRRAIRWEYLGIVALWGTIWAYTTWTGQWPRHARAVLLPMSIAAFLQTGRKFTEHLGMASFDPLLGTRTVVPRQWLLRLSSFLNFDIFVHGPHHRHPRLIHTTLQEKLEEYRRGNPGVAYPAFDRYWRATLDMLPSLVANPGCGVNAGGAVELAAGGRDEVADFLPDADLAAAGQTARAAQEVGSL